MNLSDKESRNSGIRPETTSMAAANLSEEALRTLYKMFPHTARLSVPLGDVGADLVVEDVHRIVIAEFKTGNPELPLPQSTVPQINRVIARAQSMYPGQEIVPVVVTNYEVDMGIRAALERIGARIVEFTPRKTNTQGLVSNIIREAGLQEALASDL